MNQNSPGHDSLESDIEMIDIREAASPPKPHQNGQLNADPELDDDDETLPNDDGSRGLLSGNAERTRFETKSTKKWPQVKSIVVEVRGILLDHAHLTEGRCFRVPRHSL